MRRGPLIALAIAGVAAALYFARTESLAPPPLEASLVAFEVIREPDASGAAPVRESLAASVRFANRAMSPLRSRSPASSYRGRRPLGPAQLVTHRESRCDAAGHRASANGSLDHLRDPVDESRDPLFPDGANIYSGSGSRGARPRAKRARSPSDSVTSYSERAPS
jgi:hypothetical protein